MLAETGRMIASAECKFEIKSTVLSFYHLSPPPPHTCPCSQFTPPPPLFFLNSYLLLFLFLLRFGCGRWWWRVSLRLAPEDTSGSTTSKWAQASRWKIAHVSHTEEHFESSHLCVSLTARDKLYHHKKYSNKNYLSPQFPHDHFTLHHFPIFSLIHI